MVLLLSMLSTAQPALMAFPQERPVFLGRSLFGESLLCLSLYPGSYTDWLANPIAAAAVLLFDWLAI
jgi:hypothetical protein